MSVQWFPGHMHLTRQAIAERVKEIDVVIEMLDARGESIFGAIEQRIERQAV